MKKIIALVLALLIVLPCCTLANEELSAVDQNFIVYEDIDSGCFFAKVKNTGTKGIYLAQGTLTVFNNTDMLIKRQNSIMATQGNIYLEPGEYTYVAEYLWEDIFKSTLIKDYKLLMNTQTSGIKIKRVPCISEIKIDTSNTVSSYIYVTFTNNEKEPIFGYNITAALYGDNKELIYVNSHVYDSLAVHPNSTATIKLYIDSKLIDYYKKHYIKPTIADAIVSYVVE